MVSSSEEVNEVIPDLIFLIKSARSSTPFKIILSFSQSKLEELEKLGYITIRDNGLTELEPNTLTCVTIGILDKDNIPDELKFVKRLRLL